jgi:hypothetical protein
MTDEITRRVLRRCPHCRILFEVSEGSSACVVCGARVDGLALPLDGDSAPNESVEREATVRIGPRREETS